MKRERPMDGAKRGTNTRLEVYKERKRERENGKKERRWRRRRRRRRRRRKKGALARNNAQSHGEECGPSGYTRIHERTWWVPIGRPSILFFPTGRHTRSLLDRRQIHRRIYCFAGRYVIWPLSSEPRARPRCESPLFVVRGRSLWRELARRK